MAKKSGDVEVVPTICRDCYMRCGLLITVKDGKAVKVEGYPEHPLSKGYICEMTKHTLRFIYS